MPTVPIRDLGGAGIVSDIHPYDLPPNVFSSGVNVRFENGTVSRGPVPRLVQDLTDTHGSTFTPGHVFTIPETVTGAEEIVTVAADYTKAYSLAGSTVTDRTALTMSDLGDPEAPFTSCFLGNVAYLNKRTHVPFMLRSTDSIFQPLGNWDSGWRCNVLRPYKDFLVALNVTKSSTEYPQMVKWSDIAQYGDAPPSWDETDPTTNAGENVLNEMRTPLVDGLTLRDTFMLYAENEVWSMTYTGGSFVFDFRKRFDDVGVIGPNCVVEVDGQHYVFGHNDIIVHDGSSKRSIVHGKNKNFIFGGLIRASQHLCYVTHNPELNEIMFCYPSNDRNVGFLGATTGCNRAASYNYRRDTWTFYDLPNTVSATRSVIETGQTWASSSPTSWDTMGGTYAGDGSSNDRHHIFASHIDTAMSITASRLVALDLIEGGRLAKPLVSELLKDAFAERIGIDLDEGGLAITAYKSALKIYPQVAIREGDTNVTFQFGANDTSALSPSWDIAQTFSPFTDHQLSVRKAGRYLAHRVWVSGDSDFSYSGFDALLTVRGRR